MRQSAINRSRIHTDDSIEVRFFEHPKSEFDRFAISITGADTVLNLPEPGGVFLPLAGIALIALRRHSFNSR